MTEPKITDKRWQNLPRWVRERYSFERIMGVVYHWNGAPVIPTIQNVWDYYDRVKLRHPTNPAAYHAFVHRREIWQTLDWGRVSGALGLGKIADYPEEIRAKFHGRWPDNVTINVLMIEEDHDGTYHQETVDSAILLGAFLCRRYDLEPPENVHRHSDITRKGVRKLGEPFYDPAQKPCPRFFVEHPEAWEGFRLLMKEILIV